MIPGNATSAINRLFENDSRPPLALQGMDSLDQTLYDALREFPGYIHIELASMAIRWRSK
jgi:hypothetical protein